MPKADPLRSCLGCREVKLQNELLRFVIDAEGTLFPDISKKLPGRGAYTCFSRSCLSDALKKRQFNRSFKSNVIMPAEAELASSIVRLLDTRIVSIIALANKAGKVVSGSDKVMAALKQGDVAVLVMAEDISEESRAKFVAIAQKAGAAVFSFSMKDQLGLPLGKDLRTAVAVLQCSFAATLKADLKRYWNFFEGGAK